MVRDKRSSAERGSPRVLILTYCFPPQAVVGGHRTAKLVKYWSRWGVPVAVISGPPHGMIRQDASLLAELPASLDHHAAPDPSPWLLAQRIRERLPRGTAWRPLGRALGGFHTVAQTLALPDEQLCWFPPALWHGIRVARRFRPDVLLVSGPPFSPFLAGAVLSRILRVPLVLDYRDPWTASPQFPSRRRSFRGWVNPSLERAILRRSHGIVAAHRFILRDVAPLLARVESRRPRIFWLPNGCDSEELGPEATVSGERFLISYTGSFNRWRTPTRLLQAVEELLNEGLLDESRFRLRFTGPGEAVRALYPPGGRLARVVDAETYVPHAQSVRRIQESTANIVIIGDRGGPPFWVPAKLYEAIFARRPLLLLSSEGTATHLARRAGGCWIALNEDKESIKEALMSLYGAWKEQKLPPGPDPAVLRFYERSHQARRLLRFLKMTALQG